jgi:hypothetical protein
VFNGFARAVQNGLWKDAGPGPEIVFLIVHHGLFLDGDKGLGFWLKMLYLYRISARNTAGWPWRSVFR